MTTQKSKSATSNIIAQNRKARHEFFIDDVIEAGIELQGWELKSIRAGRCNVSEAYVVIHRGEAYLHGAQITPMLQASTHVVCEPKRNRRLLLNRREIDTLIGVSEQKGHALVVLQMYWKRNWVKVSVGIARGKKQHDKRDTTKDREWQRQKERVMKHSTR